MTALENAGATQQRANGVGRLGTDAEPVVGACLIDVESALGLAGSILSDDLDEFAITRALRIRDDDTVHWRLFPPDTAETNLYHLMLP
jgi:hypothetical protein